MDNRKKGFIINTLRRASFRWPARGIADKKFKVEIGKFKNGKPKFGRFCNICKGKFQVKDTVMDHILPAVNPNSDFDWTELLDRMFPNEEGWQRLCIPCHDIKSSKELEKRKNYRKSKKIVDKKKK